MPSSWVCMKTKQKMWLQSEIGLLHSCTTMTVTGEHQITHTTLSLRLIFVQLRLSLSNQGCFIQLGLFYPTKVYGSSNIEPLLNHPAIVNPPSVLGSKWPTTVFNHLFFYFIFWIICEKEAMRLWKEQLHFQQWKQSPPWYYQLKKWWLFLDWTQDYKSEMLPLFIFLCNMCKKNRH